MKKSNFFIILLLLFSCSVAAQQQPPTIVFQKCLGGTAEDLANDVLYTTDNAILVVGSSKSNNGDVTGHHGSADSADAWVVKLSASGTVLWQRSFGGSGKDVFNSVIATNDGNYLCMGTTTSNDGDVSGLHGRSDIWMIKMDRNGNTLWKKCYGGSQNEIAGNIKQNKDGSFYFIGSTFSIDGDVSGSHNAPPYYSSDAWVLKLNKDGDIILQKCIGGSDIDEGNDIIEAERGYYIMTGKIMSQDPPFGSYTIQPFGVIAKMDSIGTKIWHYRPLSALPVQITNPAGSDYYISYVDWRKICPQNPNFGAGLLKFTYSPTSVSPPVFSGGSGFNYCNNFNPVSGYTTSSSSLGNLNAASLFALATDDTLDNNVLHRGSTNAFLAGSTANGTTVAWKKIFGGSSADGFTSVVAVNEYEMIAAGYTSSNNGDVSGNHGGADIWIVRLGQVNNIKGTVFLDYNANGNKEAGEPLVDNLIVQSQKGVIRAGSAVYKGIFNNLVDTGSYNSTIVTPVPYYSSLPLSKTTVFNTYNTSDSISFALQPVPGKRDYLINLFNAGALRPGFDNTYRVRYVNVGTDTLNNKNVRFIKDSRLQFLSSMPAPASISGDTISWLISHLNPRDTGFITVQTKALAPPALNFGNVVINSILIDSTGDLTPLNNFFDFKQFASGSYDPNDKQESGAGFLTTREMTDNKFLQYTIRFQNTGNDTAFMVVVKDTLTTKIDWASLEMITASHPYTLTIKNGNQLNWTFTDIRLVDSVQNEPGSHGYIVYRVKPQASLQVGDTIINSASIYFDFNPAVKTNIQVTVVKPNPPAVPQVTGFRPVYCSNDGLQKTKIINLPAAASGITASVKLDATVLTIAADSTFGFDAGGLTAGAHQVKIVFSNSTGKDSSVYNFTIAAAVTPNVNLSSNITTVTNLADPVIITATNAAGGGAAPKYIFAKDRLFANVLQAESAGNTLTVQPNALNVGANWVYVKMKTSDTCYTAQTNIDSIAIERSQVTGITDIDFPGQSINVYPNPFATIININGLNTGKTYSVVISNTAGQQIYTQQVSNSRNAVISKTGLQSGRYLLSIYDAKKHRLIGTLPLIKE